MHLQTFRIQRVVEILYGTMSGKVFQNYDKKVSTQLLNT